MVSKYISSFSYLYTYKYISFNFGKLIKIWITITLFRLLRHRTAFRFVPDQVELQYKWDLIQHDSEIISLCSETLFLYFNITTKKVEILLIKLRVKTIPYDN